jgi:hypothetical protein
MRLRRTVVITAVIISTVLCAYPEVRSGFWTYLEPNPHGDSLSRIDFSEAASFCSSDGTGWSCSCPDADITFKGDTIRAANGIAFSASVDIRLQTMYMNNLTISLDREGLFCMDSMMKRYRLQEPGLGLGYATSISSRNTSYFVKTKENRYAMLIKVGEYIGGINRTYYYWAFQPDTGVLLYKDRLFDVPKSLSIALDVFSGRPNPTFFLTDSASIETIVRQAYVSVNTVLDPTLRRTDNPSCPNILGYRKLSVMGMFQPESPLSSYIPTLTVCTGTVFYYKVPPVSSVEPPRVLYDRNSQLEKLIIRVCCDNALTDTDMYGAVSFCDLVPADLKTTEPLVMTDRTWFSLGTPLQGVTPGAMQQTIYDVASRRPAASEGTSGIRVFAACGAYGLRETYFKWYPSGFVKTDQQWNFVNGGLGTNDIRAICVRGDTMFVGTQEEGVMRSTNAGSNWEVFSTGLPSAATLGNYLPIDKMVLENNMVYATTFEGTVFQSALSVASWKNIDSVYSSQMKNFSPGDSPAVPRQVLYHALQSYSLTKQPDSLYTLVKPGMLLVGSVAGVKDVLFAFVPNDCPWCSSMTGGNGHVLRSLDFGKTWSESAGPIKWIPLMSFASDEIGDAFLGLGVYYPSSVLPVWYDGVYFSSDGGKAWSAFNTGLDDMYITALRVYGPELLAANRSSEVFVRDISPGATVSIRQKFSDIAEPGAPVLIRRTANAVMYHVTKPAELTIDMVDLKGRRVARCADGIHAVGEYRVSLQKYGLANGVFLLRFVCKEPATGKTSRIFLRLFFTGK